MRSTQHLLKKLLLYGNIKCYFDYDNTELLLYGNMKCYFDDDNTKLKFLQSTQRKLMNLLQFLMLYFV
jgi:hypothetical protein